MKSNIDSNNDLEQNKKDTFLKAKIFVGLENLNSGAKKENPFQFSEDEFKIVMDRTEYFGIGMYTVSSWLKIKCLETRVHDAYNKKATNPKWYKNAFIELTKNGKAQKYSATYSVSKKLITDKTNNNRYNDLQK